MKTVQLPGLFCFISLCRSEQAWFSFSLSAQSVHTARLDSGSLVEKTFTSKSRLKRTATCAIQQLVRYSNFWSTAALRIFHLLLIRSRCTAVATFVYIFWSKLGPTIPAFWKQPSHIYWRTHISSNNWCILLIVTGLTPGGNFKYTFTHKQ